MIVDAIERWMRGEYVSTTEQLERAERFLQGKMEMHFRNIFLMREERDAARPPISGSSRWSCSRNLFFALARAPKLAPAPRAFNSFFLGLCVEDMVIAQAILAGVNVVYPKDDGKQREGTVLLDGEEIPYHIDLIVEHESYGEVPVEIKSMNEQSYRETKRTKVSNTFGYVDQLGLYVKGEGAKKGIFVAVCKSTGHPLEEWHDEWEFDMAYYERALSRARAGDPGRPEWATDRFVRGVSGNPSSLEVSDIRCTYCPFIESCWKGYERKTVSGKVKWRKPLSDEEASALKNGTK